jgi:hypothetical protein
VKPREEERVLATVKTIRADLTAINRPLLEALARDDQSSDPDVPLVAKPNDPIHRRVKDACTALDQCADWALRALNLVKWVAEDQLDEDGRRRNTTPDCVACGKLALPRPRDSMCHACFEACRRFVRSGKGTREDFLRTRHVATDTGHT